MFSAMSEASDYRASSDTAFLLPESRGRRRGRLASRLQELKGCIAAIKKRRAANMHRGYRQDTVDEWVAYDSRHAWCLAAMVM